MYLLGRYTETKLHIEDLQNDLKVVERYDNSNANKIVAEIERVRQKFIDSIEIIEVLDLALENSRRIDELSKKVDRAETIQVNRDFISERSCGEVMCKPCHCLADIEEFIEGREAIPIIKR